MIGAAIVVLGTLSASAVALAAGNKAQDDAGRETRKRLAEALVEGLCRSTVKLASACPEQTGLVVFLPAGSAGMEHLETAFSFNKKGRPDASLRFGRYEGVAGHVWATGEQAFARLDTVSEDDLHRTWKLSAEYIRLTAHLKIVVGTPIRAPDNPDRILGVVTLDSDVSDAECGLASEESLEEAAQCAHVLAQILTLAQLV
jgi:hypothetical protein